MNACQYYHSSLDLNVPFRIRLRNYPNCHVSLMNIKRRIEKNHWTYFPVMISDLRPNSIIIIELIDNEKKEKDEKNSIKIKGKSHQEEKENSLEKIKNTIKRDEKKKRKEFPLFDKDHYLNQGLHWCHLDESKQDKQRNNKDDDEMESKDQNLINKSFNSILAFRFKGLKAMEESGDTHSWLDRNIMTDIPLEGSFLFELARFEKPVMFDQPISYYSLISNDPFSLPHNYKKASTELWQKISLIPFPWSPSHSFPLEESGNNDNQTENQTKRKENEKQYEKEKEKEKEMIIKRDRIRYETVSGTFPRSAKLIHQIEKILSSSSRNLNQEEIALLWKYKEWLIQYKFTESIVIFFKWCVDWEDPKEIEIITELLRKKMHSKRVETKEEKFKIIENDQSNGNQNEITIENDQNQNDQNDQNDEILLVNNIDIELVLLNNPVIFNLMLKERIYNLCKNELWIGKIIELFGKWIDYMPSSDDESCQSMQSIILDALLKSNHITKIFWHLKILSKVYRNYHFLPLANGNNFNSNGNINSSNNNNNNKIGDGIVNNFNANSNSNDSNNSNNINKNVENANNNIGNNGNVQGNSDGNKNIEINNRNSIGSNIYARILGFLLSKLNAEQKRELLCQEELIARLTDMLSQVKHSQKLSRLQKLEIIRNIIKEPENKLIRFSPAVQLPICSGKKVYGIDENNLNLFKSRELPLKLSFITVDGEKNPVIFKCGDNLRQDQFAMQLVGVMDGIWKRNGLDLSIIRYAILPTGLEDGIVQFIPSQPLSSILSEGGIVASEERKEEILTVNGSADRIATINGGGIGGSNVIRNTGSVSSGGGAILEYLRHDSNNLNNFIKSCAGYAVITFVLGVGDRHLENLLLTREGNLFHVDYAFLYGDDPKPFPPPMKLCKEMVEAIGNKFGMFKSCAFVAFKLLRRNVNLLTSCVQEERGITFIREKLALEKDEEEAIIAFEALIEESVNAMFPQVMETIHKWAQYWRK